MSRKVYVLKDQNDVFLAAFGSKFEVMCFFHKLCDSTKECFKIPMFKTDSFRVAVLYLHTLGYSLVKIKPEDLNIGKYN